MELKRITFDPNVMGGKPCIRGMRVTVGAIVGLVASGRNFDDILGFYPYLELEDIREALLISLKQPEQGERISIEKYNLELDEALERIKRGGFHTQEQVETEINNW